jgi:hypothetical protein
MTPILSTSRGRSARNQLTRQTSDKRERCLWTIARLFTLCGRTFLFFAGDALGRLLRLVEARLAEALSGFSLPIGSSFVHATSYGVRLTHKRTLPLSPESPQLPAPSLSRPNGTGVEQRGYNPPRRKPSDARRGGLEIGVNLR